ncbi:MAG: pyridoxamine 5'-phosphate oxidase family protein [Granulosicoccus sp.]|nr:pyridoxamine 5'-phosphate oxidase family protein [Granulosicoccus sp.]
MSTDATPNEVLATLKMTQKSVLLATLGEDGFPHNGYTPFIFDGKDIIIFVSRLSLHTRDLLANSKVSAMLISDESASEQIFARTRVSYQCTASEIENTCDSYASLLDRMQAKHGKMLGVLRQLPDFVLFRLHPSAGQFVMGFGQAYRLSGPQLDQFEHARSA